MALNPNIALALQSSDLGQFQRGRQEGMQNRLAQLEIGAAERQLDNQNRLREALPQAMQGDPNAIAQVQMLDPQSAEALRKRREQIISEGRDWVLAMHAAPPERRQALFERGRQRLDQLGYAQVARQPLPAQLTPEWLEESYYEVMGPDIAAQSGRPAPANVQEWRYFNSLSPQDQERYLTMKRSAQVYKMGDVPVRMLQTGPEAVPVRPAGIQAATQPEIQAQLSQQEAAKQGLVARERERQKAVGEYEGETITSRGQARQKLQAQTQQIDNVVDQINEVLQNADWTTTGVPGAIASKVRGTPAYDQERIVTTIKANLGFDKLQQMRDMSPTGGALGQVAVQELESLQASIANLDSGQSLPQFKRNLERVREHYQNWKRAAEQSYQRRYGQPGGGLSDMSDDEIKRQLGL
jgi:hypothetical protein